MRMEGNLAEHMPKPEMQNDAQRLRELRLKQMNFAPGEAFSEDEQKDFEILQAKESGVLPFSVFEKQRYNYLSAKLGRGEELESVERDEFVVLQARADKGALKE